MLECEAYSRRVADWRSLSLVGIGTGNDMVQTGEAKDHAESLTLGPVTVQSWTRLPKLRCAGRHGRRTPRLVEAQLR